MLLRSPKFIFIHFPPRLWEVLWELKSHLHLLEEHKNLNILDYGNWEWYYGTGIRMWKLFSDLRKCRQPTNGIKWACEKKITTDICMPSRKSLENFAESILLHSSQTWINDLVYGVEVEVFDLLKKGRQDRKAMFIFWNILHSRHPEMSIHKFMCRNQNQSTLLFSFSCKT
jgi:hypothetical protein